MDDWHLLQEYEERDSEAAFRILVERYANLVYSVALRQVRDAHLAEEVAQAVFLLLARKARGLRCGVVLSGWLFRTTRFVASRAVRSEQRRFRREQEAFAMKQLSATEDPWKRIAPVIDEALEGLSTADRNVVLLRFFDDKSHRETAAALGITEDAAKKRVTRALDKLRDFLAGRGVALSATVLASAIATNGAKAATPELIASLTAKVAATGSAAAGVLPSLVSQTLSAWRWAKLKIVAGVGIAIFTAAFLFLSIATRQAGVSQSAAGNETTVAPAVQATSAAKTTPLDQAVSTSADSEETNALLFRVLEAGTGGGVAGAKIAVNYVSSVKWWAGDDLITDAQGICRVPLPDGLGRLDVGVLKDGYAQKFYTWRKDLEEPLPSVYIFKVERGVAMGGIVSDEAGQAISGAEILMKFPEVGDASFREPKPERLGFIRDLVAATTDGQGRWKCAIVPAGYDDFNIEVRHPQFVTATLVPDADERNYVNAAPRFAMKDLLAGNTKIMLRSGLHVAGVVLDDAGQPLAGATVGLLNDFGHEISSATTITDGGFHFGGLAPGPVRLGASAEGFAPAGLTMDVQSSVSNIVLRLERGTIVSIRVVDEDDNAVRGAWVVADGPQPNNANWRVTSDSIGWVQFMGIPEAHRSNLRFHAGAKDFFINRDARVDLSVPEPKLQLRRALKVSGHVVDATNGAEIAWFKAIPCAGEGVASYDRSERKFGTNGNFTVTFSEYRPPFRVRIEADGYEPALSSAIQLEPREQSVEFKLQRKDFSKAIRGMIMLADGHPAAGADVALLTFERGLSINQGKFPRRGTDSITTRTDADGKFQFDPDANAHTVVSVHETGFGRARIHEEGQAIVVRLSPFGGIDGRVRTHDGQWSGRGVALTSPHSEAGLSIGGSARSDGDGHFTLDSVPAGDYTLYLNPGVGKAFTDATPVEVRAGETTEAQIGGSGAVVTGRLQFAASGPVNWVERIKFPALQPKNSPPPAPRPSPANPSPDKSEKRKRLDLVESDAWRVWARGQRPSVTLKIAADGSFMAENVRAGEYMLHVELTSEDVESSRDPIRSMMKPAIASIRQAVTISEAQEQAGESVDLGTLVLQPIQKARSD